MRAWNTLERDYEPFDFAGLILSDESLRPQSRRLDATRNRINPIAESHTIGLSKPLRRAGSGGGDSLAISERASAGSRDATGARIAVPAAGGVAGQGKACCTVAVGSSFCECKDSPDIDRRLRR